MLPTINLSRIWHLWKQCPGLFLLIALSWRKPHIMPLNRLITTIKVLICYLNT